MYFAPFETARVCLLTHSSYFENLYVGLSPRGGKWRCLTSGCVQQRSALRYCGWLSKSGSRGFSSEKSLSPRVSESRRRCFLEDHRHAALNHWLWTCHAVFLHAGTETSLRSYGWVPDVDLHLWLGSNVGRIWIGRWTELGSCV